MVIRRLILDYDTGMAVFWTLQPVPIRHSTGHAYEKFKVLRYLCKDLPIPMRYLAIADSRVVDTLPLELGPDEQVTDVILYGEYDSRGVIVRWDLASSDLIITGPTRREVPPDSFFSAEDIPNVTDRNLIGTDRIEPYKLRHKRPS